MEKEFYKDNKNILLSNEVSQETKQEATLA